MYPHSPSPHSCAQEIALEKFPGVAFEKFSKGSSTGILHRELERVLICWECLQWRSRWRRLCGCQGWASRTVTLNGLQSASMCYIPSSTPSAYCLVSLIVSWCLSSRDSLGVEVLHALSTLSAYCLSDRVSLDMSLECLSGRVSFGVGVLHTIVDSEFGVSCLSGRVFLDVSFVSFLVCKCWISSVYSECVPSYLSQLLFVGLTLLVRPCWCLYNFCQCSHVPCESQKVPRGVSLGVSL